MTTMMMRETAILNDIRGRLAARLAFAMGAREDAIVARFGPRMAEVARPSRTAGIRQVLSDFAFEATGRTISGDDDLMASAVLADRHITASGAGGSTVSSAAADAGSVLVEAAFAESSVVTALLTKPISLPDFRQRTAFRLGSQGLQRVGADGELARAPLIDAATGSQRLETSGLIVSISRQQLVNDHTAALASAFAGVGRFAALAVERAFASQLMESADTYFVSTNSNRLTSKALNATNYPSAVTALMAQRDPSGSPTLARPFALLVPPTLFFAGAALFASFPAEARPLVLTSPFLEHAEIPGNSTSTWYLFARPAEVPAFTFATLTGAPLPHLAAERLDTSGLSVQVVFDFSIGELDPRGAIKATA